MNLKPLSDSLLLSKTKSLVQSERELLTEILHHLREVDRRKLFSDLGYTSLFDYAVRELGYSEGQAGRRIQAMRLLRELPQLEEKIESGVLNLSHLSQAQSYFREAKKTEESIDSAAKLEIIEKLESKSAREAQKILLELSPSLAIPKERERILTPELSEIRFVMSEELKEKLESVKSLLGPKALGLGFAELIALMAEYTEEALKKKKFGPHLGRSEKASSNKASVAPPKSSGSAPQKQIQDRSLNQDQAGRVCDAESSCIGKDLLVQQPMNQSLPTANVGVKTRASNSSHHALLDSDLGIEKEKTHSNRRSPASSNVGAKTVKLSSSSPKSPRYIPRAIKALVWQRDQGQCCKCGSRRNLNFDHVKPIALGGGSTACNLRLLCFHCNQRARMKTFSPRDKAASFSSALSTQL